MNQPSSSLLQVEGLSVVFDAGKPTEHHALDGVSLSIGEGEIVGLVGESGSGKTVLSHTILGLLPRNGRVTTGSVRWKGCELQSLAEKKLRPIRGKEIGRGSWNPVHSMTQRPDNQADLPQSHTFADFSTPYPRDPQDASGSPLHQVIASRLFPVSLTQLWEIAGHPSKVSKAVPMLRWFQAPEKLRRFSKVAERHTIMGWPQTYVGFITGYRTGSLWSMSSKPVGWSPFPLPHDVEYAFSGDARNSSLTITCSFRCAGLLAIPFVAGIVKIVMQRAAENLLDHIATQAAHCARTASPPTPGEFEISASR